MDERRRAASAAGIRTDRRLLQFTGLVAVVALLLASGLQLALRVQGRTLSAHVASASALFEGNSVRVLGVPVGTITRIVPEGATVRVDMRLDDPALRLPADVRAAVISPSLVTGRYVQLTPPYTGGPELADGADIPLARTAVPLGVDELTAAATDLSKALGPHGANADGALSGALEVAAANLDGNGQALHDTIAGLAGLTGTLADARGELFGTVTELQSFVSTITAGDEQVREFNTRLADVAGFLAGSRDDLAGAVAELGPALEDVAAFLRDNRAALASNVAQLTEVTGVLVGQQRALAEILDVAPAALSNLSNTYNGSSGTLDTRADINELTLSPVALVCQALARGTPTGLPTALADTCGRLQPVLDGTVQVPSAAQVITALQAGTPPPVPGLALPTDARPTDARPTDARPTDARPAGAGAVPAVGGDR